jgi:hypothetical protein
MMFPSEAVARNTRTYREINMLTQAELASLMTELGLEWTAGTVGFVERYERSVTVDELVGLALCCGVPVGELLDPTGPLGIGDGPSFDFAGVDDCASNSDERRDSLPSTVIRLCLKGECRVKFSGNSMFEAFIGNPNGASQ